MLHYCTPEVVLTKRRASKQTHVSESFQAAMALHGFVFYILIQFDTSCTSARLHLVVVHLLELLLLIVEDVRHDESQRSTARGRLRIDANRLEARDSCGMLHLISKLSNPHSCPPCECILYFLQVNRLIRTELET